MTPESPDLCGRVRDQPVHASAGQVGASIGLAVLNTIAATSTDAYLAAHPRGHDAQLAGLVDGYTEATAWAAALLGIAAIAVLILVNARLGASPSRPPTASNRAQSQP